MREVREKKATQCPPVQRKLGRQTRVQGVSQLHVTEERQRLKKGLVKQSQNRTRYVRKILQDVGSDLRHSKPLHIRVMDA